MREIEGYRLFDTVYDNTHIAIYRGTRERDNLPVIVKALKSAYPSLAEINRLEHEYNIGKNLDLPGVVKYYSIENVGYGKAIVMEDFGAISLARYIRSQWVDLRNSLRIIMAAAGHIGELHRRGIIHKDINPYNILINPETRVVKITDFSIATVMHKETETAVEPGELKGTFPYISPEQTGRMNRSIDYRTDLYSLGATFYEMLTGKRPFEYDDPMELIHAHMARKPIAPHEINNDIPLPISKIIIKLLSKNAEDRYQGAAGLKADLEECYDQLQAKGMIDDFVLGSKDVSDSFLISEKLYGREKEMIFLEKIFNRAAAGEKVITLFSGPAGIGKTALTNEIHKPAAGRKYYFIDGRYDRLEKNAPQSAIMQALSRLIMHLLAAASGELETWKNEILASVGNNGKLIVDLLPQLELIIGKQPEITEQFFQQTQNRTNMVLRDFIKVFARAESPLILFLDDLQWVDDASLQLIDTLLQDVELKYFLLIGAYRDTDVDASHPLYQALKKWRAGLAAEKTAEALQEIHLSGMDRADIGRLLSDTLKCKEDDVRTLAELVFTKTAGNPFFIHEFLKKLREDRLITFANGWNFDVTEIRQADITDNVAELMTLKLQKLPENTLSAIKIAAFVGVEFPIATVAVAARRSAEEIDAELEQAVAEGILLKTGDKGKFSHNKVQEAAYLLTAENERLAIHAAIGRNLWRKSGEQDDDTYLYDLVHHLNKAAASLNAGEKSKLPRLNLSAGRKAKAAGDHQSAYRFFKQGIALLPRTDPWEKEYELCLELFAVCCETSFQAGREDESATCFAAVLENARTPMDKISVYEIMIHNRMGVQEFSQALQLGREALALLGIHLPRETKRWLLLKEFINVYTRLRMKRAAAAALLDMPVITDPRQLAVARILASCLEPAYATDPQYFALLVLRLLKLTLKNGNCAYSPFIYAIYGAILCDFMGNIEQGCAFGKLGLELLEKFKTREMSAKTYYVYGAGIHHWKNHIRGDLKYLLKSIESGMDTGDLKFASYSVDNYILKLVYSGESLPEVKKECEHYFPMVKKFRQLGAVQGSNLWYKMVLFLLGETEDRCLLTGEISDDIAFVSEWLAAKDTIRLGAYTMVRLILLYLFGDFSSAVEIARQGEKYVKSIVGDIHIKEFYYYYSLAIMAHYHSVDKKKQAAYLKLLHRHEKKMKKWADYSPENFLHKYLLIKAGRYWLIGRMGEAIGIFKHVVLLARKSGFIHEEAASYECAARLSAAFQLEEISSFYTGKAHYLYGLWGAKAKVKDLEEKFPELIQLAANPKETTGTGSGSSDSTSPSLDFNAVIKASRVISGEIVMERLLAKLIRIVMENAGAQKIVLFLKKDGRLVAAAEGKIEEQEAAVFKQLPLEECALPQSLIRFVERVEDFVVLADSSRLNPFSQDPYIIDQPPMSMMAMPVVHQEALVGVLYLENRLGLDVFTRKQQETLKVLAAQAAVSLQNAMFYDHITQAEARVRKILETTNEGFLEINGAGYITGVNPEMCAISGRSREALLGCNFFQLLTPADRELALQKFKIHNLDKSSSYRLSLRKPDSTAVPCLINATPLFDKNGDKRGSFAMVTDLTEYEKKDMQLRQAQKMETVGTLAGGLAHDFNNILGGITGSLSLLQLEMKKEAGDKEEIEKYLDDMVEAAGRAVDIVKQLLALARKEELVFEAVDLNGTIRSVMRICQNTFEKSIELNPGYNDNPAVVLADPTQLEQILLNLCVNASHAMTIMKKEGERWGGVLAVFLDKIYADLHFCELHPGAVEGYYWKLCVQDEGIGMDADTVSRIFEPFFTTKMTGSGTGLGLSMVYNIVRQHKGVLEVLSEPGKGSSFIVYLPEYGEVLAPVEKKKEEELMAGEGLILVVDDEPIMRKIAIKILEKAGYHVIFAEDGEKGIELFNQYHLELKMVLLDMQMPKKSGRETYIAMRGIDPAVKVLLTSGFQRDERVEAILRLGVDGFIEKPYTFGQLIKAIQKIMTG